MTVADFLAVIPPKLESAFSGARRWRGLAVRAILSMASALMLSGCSPQADHSYNYRTTIEIETPSELRSGSSVTRVEIRQPRSFVTPGIIAKYVEAEATPVKLPGGKMLFALIRGPRKGYGDIGSLADRAFNSRLPAINGKSVTWEDRLEILKQQSGTVALSSSDYPMFVYFSNLNDPDTIAEVDPGDLGSTFGDGYRLKRITVQIVDTGPTHDTISYLPWVAKNPSKKLADFHYVTPRPLTRKLETDDFDWRLDKRGE